ncbi:MAG: hypothetical protein WCK51_03495 [Armatimonadota bacterium]
MSWQSLELMLELTRKCRVLIIEDHVSFALRLRETLRQYGHQIHSYSGIERVDQRFFGIDPHHAGDPSEIELAQYEVCFLDHYFAGTDFNGSTLLGVLGHYPIRVCGMSSVDSANESMRRHGALTSIRKDKLDQLLTP